ncbi:hypothetical protein CLV84_0632 [Neolewinella xylanilytica]|uniref:DUF2975 domain-containing protein n=1 Tax=Neolewinella xylanilytica TaxID=1514080 RepID=A0A2S6I870_9BACT|nr:hypothetical protein [Neolewinella xylanilytica]PPK87682.1 hypothetical protein CLV84_0632 [Neolewinella xylanilytica]
MKRNTLLTVHLIATIVAALTIATFFSLSLFAELKGDDGIIRSVKAFILYAMPIMILAMPTLKITGDKLAGKSKSPLVLAKVKRMKLILVNGICLVSLAIFLYYRSHYQSIDSVFLLAQIAEFIFGLANLTLIVLNARDGMQLSGKLQMKANGI